MRAVRLLVLGNGAAGAEKQALALGNRLREKLLRESVSSKSHVRCPPVQCVRVTLGRSRVIPPVLQVIGARLTGNPLFGYAEQDTRGLLPVQKTGRELDVVIGCGRSTVALCAVLKQLSPTRTFNVQIQHPRVPLAWFDAVVVPRHDFPKGGGDAENLYLTSGTVHDITPAMLQQHGGEWSQELDDKLQGRRARVVWLLGGPCRGFSFSAQDAEGMVEQFVAALPRGDDVAVLVTFSRRTPKHVQRIIRQGLRARLPAPGQLLVWDGTERRNPYYALLSMASCIVTTPDSISMTTEAIASGKPVLTISVEHSKVADVGMPWKGKFQRFHQSLFKSKATAPFSSDALADALHRSVNTDKRECQTASAALEKEISAVVDGIAANVEAALGNIEKSSFN